jgi:hypothetical protein
MTAQATHQNAGNDFDYVGHLEVAQTGQWDVTVTITEDELGEAEIPSPKPSQAGLQPVSWSVWLFHLWF